MKRLREALPAPSELSVLRRPVNHRAARPPIGARHRSGSGNAITELAHHIYQRRRAWLQNAEQGCRGSQHRASARSLTGRCSRRSLTASLRHSLMGAAELGR